MKAIRGAICLENNEKDEIIEKTRYLFSEIVKLNNLVNDEVVSVITSATHDITDSYPGEGIRKVGFEVPILCLQEQFTKNSMPLCIRLMVYVNRDSSVRNVYVGKARNLRPDLYGE